MEAVQLIYEFSREVAPAADPVGVVQYYSNDAQVLAIKDGAQYSELTEVQRGDWALHDTAKAISNSPATFGSMRLDHPSMGALFGITNDMTFHLYVYAADISDMVENSEVTEQTDNQMKGLSFSLKNTKNALFEADSSLFLPGAQVTMALTMGAFDEYFEMGKYFLDSAPFDPFSATFNYQGRSAISRLKDSNFDTYNSPTLAKFTGTNGAIAAQILIRYSDGEIPIEDIIVDLTGATTTAEFEPSANVLDAFNKWLTSVGWTMVELYDGRYVIGAQTGLIKQYTPSNRYTFTRERDVFTRRIDRSGDGVYSRIGVKYGDPATFVFAEVATFPYWYAPTHKTLYVDAPEGSTAAQAQYLADAKAQELQFIGIKEQCTGLIRPELTVGDVAQMNEGGTNTVTGVITETKHQMGPQGYFTTFVTDSGGVILADDGTNLAVAITSSVWGANRQRRMTDFIQKPTGGRKGAGDTGASGPAGLPGGTGATGTAGTDGTAGTNGTDGAPGADGAPGVAGIGVPVGGILGQVLTKRSSTDFDAEWV